MKQLGSIAGVLLVFVLSAFTLVVIYDKGKDQKALSTPWNNDGDVGQDPDTGMNTFCYEDPFLENHPRVRERLEIKFG